MPVGRTGLSNMIILNMKKSILIFFLCLLLPSVEGACQVVKAQFGIDGGGLAAMLNSEPATIKPMSFNGYGGIFATVNFKKYVSLRVSADYMMTSSSFMESDVLLKADRSYVHIPVSILYNIRSFISIEAGVYQNVLLTSKFTEKGKTEVILNPDTGAIGYNLGVLAGVTFNIGRFVFLNFRYNYGLMDSYIVRGERYPDSMVTAGLGINIITTRKKAF